ncbi:hypothetical protein ALC56_02040 [Trachymyrmex septentrionalis]|uniref:Uncharacterized protein n=1 Tax=Trachymyrmex septentrionalis TaxID=34720 RepID=A0A195FU09_9HYME|nr:hypothetical protein ALC56_02040 [Trachymyrmex septentrionalis]
MILRNPRGRSKTRPAKKKTLDTRHMVKIQAESPEAEHFELISFSKFRSQRRARASNKSCGTNFAVLTKRCTDYRVSRHVLCSSAFFIRATILKLAVGGRRANRVGFVAVAVSVRAAKRMVMSV